SFLMVSLILGGIGLFFGQEIMELLNTPENILEQATEYLNIYFLGLPFLFMYNILSAMFNALGRSKIPLYLLIFSSVFNIVLDV
ncbi:MATE family efflux transporter, partial [Acinetobacter baumannii]|nr:MATE family efflux transporter [Acinetobacter baumannii]